MPYRKAAPSLGLTDTGLYNLIRAGKVPAVRIGGKRGRWYVDIDLVRETIEKMMLDNMKDDGDGEETAEGFLYPRIRRIS